jgi:hypothetical protein
MVCQVCQSKEDEDYALIMEVLAENAGLGVEGLAAKAGVTVSCVLRMLDSGRIEAAEVNEMIKCGRCGRPAISKSKRLCQACLVKMDQEWAETIQEMRQSLAPRKTLQAHSVHETVQKKRQGLTPPKAPEKEDDGKNKNRMVTPQRLRDERDKRS